MRWLRAIGGLRWRYRASWAGRLGVAEPPALSPALHCCSQVADPSCILLYGFKVAFGGGRSTGFAMVYDNLVAAKKYEPKYRLTRFGMGKAKGVARKQRKERKNRAKKVRGVKKSKS